MLVPGATGGQSLRHLQTVTDGDVLNTQTVDGLADSFAAAVSPDGMHVYVGSGISSQIGSDNAIAVFACGADGRLAFVEAEFDDDDLGSPGTADGLRSCRDVLVSADGKHVYTVAGSSENFTGSDALAVFSWTQSAGSLSFVASYFEGQVQAPNIIDGLDRVSSVTVSPDGRHVYATGAVNPLSGGDQDWIAIFARDMVTGELTWLDSIDHYPFCEFDIVFGFETDGVVSPDNRRFFATSPATALVGFLRDPLTGALTFIDADCYFDSLTENFSTGINLPRKLGIDPSGVHIYVPGQASDAVGVFGPEPPGLEILGVSGGQAMLRATNLSAGLPSAIESGPDLLTWPDSHSFIPESTIYEWSRPVGGAEEWFFRVVIE